MRPHLYIGGAFNKYRFIAPNLIKWKNQFKKFQFTFYDSWKNSVWNGGRVNIMYNRYMATLDVVKMYNQLGIGVGITFTNPRIDDLSLDDENKLLCVLNATNINSVAVANESLAKYIRDNYPNIKLLRSITSFNSKFDIHELKQLELKYDLICPRYDWVFNPDFYTNIDVSKYEILVNDCCMVGCPVYKEHYTEVAALNYEDFSNPSKDDYNRIFGAHSCWLSTYKNDNISSGWEKDKNNSLSCIHMGAKEIGKLYDIGYRHFKFLGKASMNKDFVQQMNTLQSVLQYV